MVMIIASPMKDHPHDDDSKLVALKEERKG